MKVREGVLCFIFLKYEAWTCVKLKFRSFEILKMSFRKYINVLDVCRVEWCNFDTFKMNILETLNDELMLHSVCLIIYSYIYIYVYIFIYISIYIFIAYRKSDQAPERPSDRAIERLSDRAIERLSDRAGSKQLLITREIKTVYKQIYQALINGS